MMSWLQNKIYFGFGLVILGLCIQNATADSPPGKMAGSWVGARSGNLPENSMASGLSQGENADLFVCRALYKSEVNPGRTSANMPHACTIVSGNEIAQKPKFEVLRDDSSFHWVAVRGEWVPSNVVKTGMSSTGDSYYSCRFFYESGLYLGKVVREKVNEKDYYSCLIAVGSTIQKTGLYEILVQDE